MSEYYPTYLTWKASLAAVATLEDLMHGSQARRVRRAGGALAAAGYWFTTSVIDAEYLEQFVPIYTRHIAAKEHGVVFDVRRILRTGGERGRTYEAVSLWHGKQLMGGLVYSVRADRLSVAYRVFPYQLPPRLPISCGYVAEQHLLERALALGKAWIIHGKDHNPYGPYSTIGLARYKLSVGYSPYVSRAPDTTFRPVPELVVTDDTLLFLGEAPGQKITMALLLVRRMEADTRERHQALFRYPAVRVTLRAYE